MDRRLILILLTMFLDVFGVGLIIPVAPFYATAFGADAFAVGLLFTSYSAAQFLATPVLGSLSDRYGRRPILIVSLLGEAVGYTIMGFADSLGVLYASRVLTGATAGNISAAQAYLADITSPQDRTRVFSLVGATFGAGFVCGPAVASILSSIDLRLTAFVAAGLVLLSVLFALVMLPESLPRDRRSSASLIGHLNPVGTLIKLARRPILQAPLAATFLLNAAFACVQGNIAVFLNGRFGFGPAQVAPLFVGMALLSVVVQGVVLRRLSARVSDRVLLLTGVSVTFLAFVTIAIAYEPMLSYAALGLFSAGQGMWRVPLTSLITKLVSEREQGMASGGAHSTMALAAVCGPVLAGLLYDTLGSAWPYWAGALMVTLAGSAMVVRRHEKIASGAV